MSRKTPVRQSGNEPVNVKPAIVHGFTRSSRAATNLAKDAFIRTARIRHIRVDQRAISMHYSPRIDADAADLRGSRHRNLPKKARICGSVVRMRRGSSHLRCVTRAAAVREDARFWAI